MKAVHISGYRAGSVTIRAAAPTNPYKKKEDKIPFDAICLTCDKPTCKGECSMVGGKDKMDKKEKAANARVRIERQMGKLTVGSDTKNISNKAKKVK